MSTASAMPSEADRSIEERAFGFWLFLMSDAIIFALLFATYAVMAQGHWAAAAPAQMFDLKRTAIETAVLLLSSLSLGMASVAIAARRRDIAILWLIVTALLGARFVMMEVEDFRTLITQGAGPQVNGYLSAYFTLIGTHGLHVTIGLVGIAVMMAQLLLRGLQPLVISRLARLGLFWHFLDIVWIGIYSVVLLPGMLR
ncbi:MAG: cytochrome c oxidase subunit 3 [Rhizobiales bacterium]|nr:cytochrome c oxidase subunit 3 [Hyphomicrobiales bacterium]